MNLTQLEWIESGLKHKSYHCFKLDCYSRVLNYETVIFFFTSSSSTHREPPWPWGKEQGAAQGEGAQPGRRGHERARVGEAAAVG
jgi:hypothetical protein